MSFRKAIEAGKEPRRKRGQRAARACEHNGSCSWCRSNRLYRTNKMMERVYQLMWDANESTRRLYERM